MSRPVSVTNTTRLARLLFDALSAEDYSAAAELLAQGADPNVLLPEGAAAFHLAVGLDSAPDCLTGLLLEYGANPNIQSCEGLTPLHVAASYGHCEVVQLLLLNGSNPHIFDQDGQTPVDCAFASGCNMCILLMQQFVCDYEADNQDEPAFSIKPYDPDMSSPYTPTRQSPGCVREESLGLEGLTLDSTSEGSCTEPLEDDPHPQHSGYSSMSNTQARGSMDTAKIPAEGHESGASESTASASFHTCTTGEGDSTQLESSGNDSRLSQDDTRTRNCVTYERGNVQKSPKTVNPKPLSSVTDRKPVEYLTETLPSGAEEQSRAFKKETGLSNPPCLVSDIEGLQLLDSSIRTSNSSDLVPSEFDPGDLSLNSDVDVAPQKVINTENTGRAQEDWFTLGRDAWYKSQWFTTAQKCKGESTKEFRNNTALRQNQKDSDTQGVDDLLTSDESDNEHNQLASVRPSRRPPDSRELTSASPEVLSTLDTGISSDKLSPNLSKAHVTSFGRPTLNQSQQANTIDLSTTTFQRNISFHGGPKAASPSKTSKSKPAVPSANSCKVSQERYDAFSLPPSSNMPCTESSKRKHNSSTSSTETIQFVYTDNEDNYSLFETWFPTEHTSWNRLSTQRYSQGKGSVAKRDSSGSETVVDNSEEAACKSPDNMELHDRLAGGDPKRFTKKVSANTSSEDWHKESGSCENDIAEKIALLTDAELKADLVSFGEIPGPITSSTRRMYQLKLARLRKDPTKAKPLVPGNKDYMPELKLALSGDLNTSTLQELEDVMARPFTIPDPSRHWREGTRKSSFNYLLLDPRITRQLPSRAKEIGELEALDVFIKSVFYIGKGKRARPYAHFKEAIQHNQPTDNPKLKQAGAKVQRILGIWDDGLGVVSLHVYQNVIPVEAYTREACMIEAIGLPKLTNVKAGEYYGLAATWPVKKKRLLGVRLLHKALRIFLSEGERHIRPSDIKGS